MPAGYHHITLRVTDLDRARAFYAGVLGFTVDQDFPGEKLRLRFGAGPARLVLHPLLPGTPAGDRFTEARVGLDHIAVAATRDEVTRLTDELGAAGVRADLHRDPLGSVLVSFRDPDNIQWEFFEDS
ncbi:MAG TPA: VOC family protein [Streptosporangiaceae bacterium]|nr:VOC family protein [Streptosporangiaceae bacterium]